jgi:hypothetical protein
MLMILSKNRMKKMKKVLFLMFLLFLLILGTAGVKAQVRIGGNTSPNMAAVLDLNTAEGATGTKGLALPRVSLSSNTATLDGITANITGMLVYNTSGSLSTGVYYWNGTNWNRIDDGFLGGDTIVGNEVTNATNGGGLVRVGGGNSASPYTLGIASVPDDSALVLRTDGKSVFWGSLFSQVHRDLDTLTTLRARTATVALLLDTTFVGDYTPLRINWYRVPGLAVGDFCYSNANAGLYAVAANTNRLYLLFLGSEVLGPLSINVRVKCYRFTP